jgi:hypothetical protein
MTTTLAKQTAGNNKALVAIKRAMNATIYKQCLGLMNDEGPEAVRDYLREFFRPEAWDCVDRLMAGGPLF